MKTLFAVLLLAAVASAAPPEAVIVLNSHDVTKVASMLVEGWTVKHQSMAVAFPQVDYISPKPHVIMVFTLTPPPPEVLAATAERKRAEFAKKREEYAKKKAGTPVEKDR